MNVKTIVKKILKSIQPTTILKAEISILAPSELLKNRTALVTGGTSGIGKSIAIAFLNAGANIIFTSRDAKRAKHIEDTLREQFPSRIIYGVELDNRNVKSFDDAFQQILGLDGVDQIDILVNNAGVGNGVWGKTSEEEYDNVMETNLKGLFFLTDKVAHYMIDKGIKGNILNVCSSSSLRPANSAYCLSKWGLRGFTEGLAKTLIPYDIVVNGIAPGPTATPLMGKENAEDLFNEYQPNNRYALPEEIASLAVIYVSNMGRTIVGDIAYMTGGCAVFTYDDNLERYKI